MLSGVLTSDNLTEAFRALSQKRRHGVFEVSSESGQVEILFHNGRIIGARKAEESVSLAICLRLIDGKRLKKELAQSLMRKASNIAELKIELVDTGIVSEEDFELAKESCEMDLLYSLRDSTVSGFFKFQSKMIAPTEEHSLSVPPTRLLLDLVELDVDEDRFAEIFGELDSDTVINAENGNAIEFSMEESVVWSCLDVSDSLKEICKMTLLSEYQLKESLLSLHDRGLLSVKKERGGSLSSLGVACIDEELSSGTWNTVQGDSEEESFALSDDDSLSTVIEHAADLLEGSDDFQIADEDLSDTRETDMAAALHEMQQTSIEEDSAEDIAGDETDTNGIEIDDELFDSEMLDDLDSAPASAILSAISETNISLLSESRAREAAVIVVCLGLVALAFFAPPMVEQWFVALSDFASVGDFPVIQ